MANEGLKGIDFKTIVPEYASRYPMEMAILRLGGVYPNSEGKAEGFRNPYTGEIENEYFGNVGEHCVAVSRAAGRVARAILGENDPQVPNIEERALIHDATKGFEIMRKKALKAGLIDDAYSPKAYETIKPHLESQGVAPDIIDYMANAGAETGHNSLKDFIVIEDGDPKLKTQDNLAEMIVHLADDMTCSSVSKSGEAEETKYLTTEERMMASDFPNRYPFIYKEGFGFNEAGEAVSVKDVVEEQPALTNIRTYAEWQVWVGREISRHLVEQISPETLPEDSEQFLKELVNSTVADKKLIF